jgi:hypothetical protein
MVVVSSIVTFFLFVMLFNIEDEKKAKVTKDLETHNKGKEEGVEQKPSPRKTVVTKDTNGRGVIAG